jgi:DNA-binding protein H-NS
VTKIVQLLTEFEELRARQEIARKLKRKEIIAEIRRMMVDLKISPRELGIGDHNRPDRLSTRLAPHPKFRHPETGETWSGRGRAPAWIAGQDRERFRIK